MANHLAGRTVRGARPCPQAGRAPLRRDVGADLQRQDRQDAVRQIGDRRGSPAAGGGGADARGRGHVGTDTGGAWPAPPSPSRRWCARPAPRWVPGRSSRRSRRSGPGSGTSALVWRLDGSGTGTGTQVRIPGRDRPHPGLDDEARDQRGRPAPARPAFRFETRVVAGASTVRRGKALMGPIYLRGAGDPVLATRSYAAAYLAGRATQMAALAAPEESGDPAGPRLDRRGRADLRLPAARAGLAVVLPLLRSPLSGLATNQDTPATGAAPTSRAPRSPRPSA